MTKSLKECLRAQVSMKTLVLVTGIWLVLQGTANAAVTLCSDSILHNFPTPPVTQPNPAETRAVQDVVSRYGLALENKDPVVITAIFDPTVTFEVCKAGGNIQDFKATTRLQVEGYYNDLWLALTSQGLTTLHILSKLILNKTGPNTVEGAFTQLVFLQTSFGTLKPDYAGRIKATFKKVGPDWLFEKFLLISVVPDLGGGIETRAR